MAILRSLIDLFMRALKADEEGHNQYRPVASIDI